MPPINFNREWLISIMRPALSYNSNPTDKSLKKKGITGSYYSKADFKGEIAHTRVDKNIDFVWWTKAPFDDMNPASFSVRWEGILVPPVSGKYAIGGEAFNGFDVFYVWSFICDYWYYGALHWKDF